MAEIIDNVKVGLFIKSLLKEKQMTQDQLAETLFITKGAVSQNLNGKSAFDIQNLVKIAEVFNITLDDLVAGRRKPIDQGEEAEYVKLIRRGLVKFKTYNPDELNIATPDIYGKLLIDYVLEEKLNDWVVYLVDSRATLVQPYYHRYNQVMGLMVLFSLKNMLACTLDVMTQWVQNQGELKFSTPFAFDEFLSLLNEKKHQSIAKALIEDKVTFSKPLDFLFFKIDSPFKVHFIPHPVLLKAIVRLKLLSLFSMFTNIMIKPLSFNQQERYFMLCAEGDFVAGIKFLIDHLKPLQSHQAIMSEAMLKSSLVLAKHQAIDTLRQGIEHFYFLELQRLVIDSLSNGYALTSTFLLDHYAGKLNLKKLVVFLIEINRLDTIETYKTLFTPPLLSYALDTVKLSKVTEVQLKQLIKLGAEFNPLYANADTATKMNMLLTHNKGNKII